MLASTIFLLWVTAPSWQGTRYFGRLECGDVPCSSPDHKLRGSVGIDLVLYPSLFDPHAYQEITQSKCSVQTILNEGMSEEGCYKA